jgi:hypothetical protein
MRRNMFVAVSAVAAALVIAAGAGAANAPSPSYQLAGFALGTPQGTTTFLSGFATGSAGDRGFWRANVTTTPLATCSTLGSSCTVTGGTFTLMSNNGSRIDGAVQGGTVTLTDQTVSTCSRQQYTFRVLLVAADGTSWWLTGVVTQVHSTSRGTCCPGASVQGTLAEMFNPPPG